MGLNESPPETGTGGQSTKCTRRKDLTSPHQPIKSRLNGNENAALTNL
jgi:hypothetical protein